MFRLFWGSLEIGNRVQEVACASPPTKARRSSLPCGMERKETDKSHGSGTGHFRCSFTDSLWHLGFVFGEVRHRTKRSVAFMIFNCYF